MARQSARTPRLRMICRRIAPAAGAIITAAAVSSPAQAAGSSPAIVVSGDSVVASSLSSFGQATVQATRPDTVTGKPVVIGQYSANANPFTPFSVNTTTPTPLNPAGDCWQKGALSEALTPDLQPGDTVTLTQAGFFGSPSTTTSAVVGGNDSSSSSAGPQAGCDSIAPWARNAITSAPSSVTDGSITVSGVAQPLATAVAVSASDSSHSTAPVSVTPAADGSWSATIPAAQLSKLANATLALTPVFAVPDVSTGAASHIAGVGATVKKSAPPTSGAPPKPAPGAPAATPAPGRGKGSGSHSGQLLVTGLRGASRLTLAAARRHGIAASFIVPAGATTVQVELLRGARPMDVTVVRAAKAGSRQTVTLGGSRLRRLLRRGRYTIEVRAGASRSSMGTARTHQLTVR